MIGALRGKLLKKEGTKAYIDVNGIIFEVNCDLFSLNELEEGKEIFIYTLMLINQEEINLFGFSNEKRKFLFQKLIKVSKLGPKTALKILSSSDASEIAGLIVSEDVARLSKIPGIGRKTAERIIAELKDQVKEIASEKTMEIMEAIEALTALGYSENVARKCVRKVAKPGMDVSEIIKKALKEMSNL